MSDGGRPRNDSIDVLRGLVMVLMVLDHCRDFVHGGFASDPTDLATTNAALFATRWITHFCAPVFVFLAGTGAFLRGTRTSRGDNARFLLTRGLWLLVLEVTVVRFGVTFDCHFGFLAFLQVIWALGVSMIALSALIWLPPAVVGGFGVAMVALHNLLDRFAVAGGPPAAGLDSLWFFIHQQGPVFPFGQGAPLVFIAYPLVPWIGVMAAGYAFGAVYRWAPERRRPFLLGLGGAMIAAFVVLRAGNLYGDPSSFSQQPTALFTVLSFVNTTKYPASLQFLFMTLGPAIVLLGLIDGRRVWQPLVTLGRVPLFFYLLQWPAAHVAGIVIAAAAGASLAPFFANPLDQVFFSNRPSGLGMVYVAWAGCILVLYPLCAGFARLKQRRRDWWLSYL